MRTWYAFACCSAIRALPETLLLRSPESRLKYEKLVSDILVVLRHWSDRWTGQAEWQSFLNRKSFCHEVEEAVVPIYEVIALVEARHSRDSATAVESPAVLDVVDLCCGKGFFAMILSYLAPQYPLLEKYIRRIVIVEKNTDIKWNHIDACNTDVREAEAIATAAAAATGPVEDRSERLAVLARLHIEVWPDTNVHSEEFERKLLGVDFFSHQAPLLGASAPPLPMPPSTVAAAVATAPAIPDASGHKPAEVGLVLVGIHLCRRLSSRFVELANMCHCRESRAVTVGAVLAPCCLPRFSGSVFVQKRPVITADGAVLCGPAGGGKAAAAAAVAAAKKLCWRCGLEGHPRSECMADDETAAQAKKRRKTGELLTKVACGAGEGKAGAPLGHQMDAGAYSEMDLTVLSTCANPFRAWCEFLFESLVHPRDGTGCGSGSSEGSYREILRVELADGVRHGVGGSSGAAPAPVQGVGSADCSTEGSRATVTNDSKNWNDFRKTTWLVIR